MAYPLTSSWALHALQATALERLQLAQAASPTGIAEPAQPALAILSDEACMARYQQGNDMAFRLLYGRYRDRLHRYALRLARQHSEAEELFQEVWLAVIRGRHTYRSGAPFAAWLFSIAHRRAADRWRSLGRHAPDAQHGNTEDAQQLAEQHAAPTHTTPDQLAHTDELRDALLHAIEQLPLPQREAFLLRAEGGLGPDEIASITGVTRETAKSRLRYAHQRLRAALEAWR